MIDCLWILVDVSEATQRQVRCVNFEFCWGNFNDENDCNRTCVSIYKMPMTRMPSLNGFYQEKQEKEKAESGEENKV